MIFPTVIITLRIPLKIRTFDVIIKSEKIRTFDVIIMSCAYLTDFHSVLNGLRQKSTYLKEL